MGSSAIYQSNQFVDKRGLIFARIDSPTSSQGAAMNQIVSAQVDPEFERKQYRRALSRFATGVAVMTTMQDGGAPAGVTVNSFSSVSLEPPLVLWSLALSSSMFAHFEKGARFGVNVLGSGQTELSRRFSTKGLDRFAGVSWRLSQAGVPLLNNALATFECAVEARHPAGDHMIFVGRVLHYDDSAGEPLIFHSGAYWQTRTL
jgi:flavin reductase (DIM6/NTAB) family NADH-FMN oxidoreductase RutF